MFGYVNVCKDELKIKDYKQFRAYYCGLCKSIGHFCGNTARVGLSYDMVFLLILLSAVSDEKPVFSERRCALHPFSKHMMTNPDHNSQYVSKVGCVLSYLKCSDDFSDERSIKGLLGMALYKPSLPKTTESYNEIYSFIKSKLNELTALEKENCADYDKTADCFAKITEKIFELHAPESQRRAMKWIGYNIGRWVYLIDAFSDIKKDYKSGAYNPFLCNYKPDSGNDIESYTESLSVSIEPSMTYTLSAVASTYELLDIKRNDEILRNIIYIGLPQRQQTEFAKNKKGLQTNESI